MDVLAYRLAQQLLAEHIKRFNSSNYQELMMSINIYMHWLNKQQLKLSIHQWYNQSMAFTITEGSNHTKESYGEAESLH